MVTGVKKRKSVKGVPSRGPGGLNLRALLWSLGLMAVVAVGVGCQSSVAPAQPILISVLDARGNAVVSSGTSSSPEFRLLPSSSFTLVTSVAHANDIQVEIDGVALTRLYGQAGENSSARQSLEDACKGYFWLELDPTASPSAWSVIVAPPSNLRKITSKEAQALSAPFENCTKPASRTNFTTTINGTAGGQAGPALSVSIARIPQTGMTPLSFIPTVAIDVGDGPACHEFVDLQPMDPLADTGNPGALVTSVTLSSVNGPFGLLHPDMEVTHGSSADLSSGNPSNAFSGTLVSGSWGITGCYGADYQATLAISWREP